MHQESIVDCRRTTLGEVCSRRVTRGTQYAPGGLAATRWSFRFGIGGAEDGLDRALLGLRFTLDLGSHRLGALEHLRIGFAGLEPGFQSATDFFGDAAVVQLGDHFQLYPQLVPYPDGQRTDGAVAGTSGRRFSDILTPRHRKRRTGLLHE